MTGLAGIAIPLVPALPDRVELHFARRGCGPEFDMEARWILRRVPTAARTVVEIGCGNAHLLQRLGFGRSIGLDLCHAGLVATRSRFAEARLVAGRGDRLPMCDGIADVVIAQHVLEHLEASIEALREWHRVLRPDGRLFVLTPNRAFADPSVFDDPTHVQLFDSTTLTGVLRNTGFAVVELASLGLPWFRRVRIAGGWRLRRAVLAQASWLARWPALRWKGQTLCCAARKRNA